MEVMQHNLDLYFSSRMFRGKCFPQEIVVKNVKFSSRMFLVKMLENFPQEIALFLEERPVAAAAGVVELKVAGFDFSHLHSIFPSPPP